MVLAETHSLKKEENKMLDVHALRGERYMCVQPCMHKKLEALSYDGGANMARHVDGDNLEGFQFEYYEKISSRWFKRKRSSSRCILFLFLPCKEFARGKTCKFLFLFHFCLTTFSWKYRHNL